MTDTQRTPDTLVVFVHGLRGSAASMDRTLAAARAALGEIDAFAPTMPYGGRALFTRAAPCEIVGFLLDGIDRRWAARVQACGTGYRRIYLIGHSIGGLVQRKVTVIAHGETPDAPFEAGYDRFRAPRPWAARITRLVMLAGMAKGWSLTSASTTAASFQWRLGMIVGTLLGAGRGMVMEARRGLPFVIQTRLQWLALVRRASPPALEVVQIIGTRDDLVAPDDMIDLAVDIDVGGSEFALLEMPDTDHRGILAMAPPAPDADPREAARWQIFVHALTAPMAAVQSQPPAIAPALLADGSRPLPERKVTDVVFVIHGIRDRGFWTQKIARKIKEQVIAAATPERPRMMRSMTASYGYLAMLPFVWVGVRRMKTAWLMDQYVECRALYPDADFHYVGHSNGTYLGARALRDYPAARFKRVVFAGSVVRSDYDWRSLITAPRRQVDALLNYVATQDLVVAALPTGLGLFDLGGAGNAGFRQFAARPCPPDCANVLPADFGAETSYQLNYVRGGHSAGIKESQWDDIAAFVATGREPIAQDPDYAPAQARFMSAIARVSAVALVPLAILILIGLGFLLVSHPHLAVIAILLIGVIVTRF